MSMGIIGTMALIVMCVNVYMSIRHFRDEKKNDAGLTFRRYIRRYPRTPVSVGYYLFLVISYPVYVMLENKGVGINESAFIIFQLIVFALVVVLTRHLEKTKDDK